MTVTVCARFVSVVWGSQVECAERDPPEADQLVTVAAEILVGMSSRAVRPGGASVVLSGTERSRAFDTSAVIFAMEGVVESM